MVKGVCSMEEFNLSGLLDRIFPAVLAVAFGLAAIAVLVLTVKLTLYLYAYFKSPKKTLKAVVVGKRADVSYDHGWTKANGRDGKFHTYSTYFTTFEMENGDRIELEMQGPAYGLLVNGDVGELTFKGSRYIDFERERPDMEDDVVLETVLEEETESTEPELAELEPTGAESTESEFAEPEVTEQESTKAEEAPASPQKSRPR